MGYKKDTEIKSPLAFYRIKSELSQRELGEKLGLTRRKIQYYELYSKKIPLDIAVKISKVLKIHVDDLLKPIENITEQKNGGR